MKLGRFGDGSVGVLRGFQGTLTRFRSRPIGLYRTGFDSSQEPKAETILMFVLVHNFFGLHSNVHL